MRRATCSYITKEEKPAQMPTWVTWNKGAQVTVPPESRLAHLRVKVSHVDRLTFTQQGAISPIACPLPQPIVPLSL